MKPFRLLRAKRYDASVNIDTCGEMQVAEILEDSRSISPEIVKYQPIQLHVLDTLSCVFNELGREYDSFVDIGCGKGRACFYAAPFFKKVVGVDLSRTLVEKANRNLESFTGIRQDIKFCLANAESFILPPSRCVIFMFNPFGPWILKKFIVNNIDNFMKGRCVLIYCNDLHSNVLLEQGINLIARHNGIDTSIFDSQASSRLTAEIEKCGWRFRRFDW